MSEYHNAMKNAEMQPPASATPKEFFSPVNIRKPISVSIGPLTMEKGSLTTSNAEISEVLNNYFFSVFIEERNDAIPKHPIRFRGIHPLEDIQCITAETTAEVKTHKVNKSAGSDGFFPRVIKADSDKIIPIS